METIKLKKEKTMAINITAPELRELKPRIVVLGVGGAGIVGDGSLGLARARAHPLVLAAAQPPARP